MLRSALALLIVGLLLHSSARPSGDRPVRTEVTVWHNFPAGYTAVQQHYRLLEGLASPGFVVTLPVDQLSALEIRDESSATLPYTFSRDLFCDCRAIHGYQITVTLPTVEAGYDFTATYRFNQYGRSAEAGILEYLVTEADREQHWSIRLPTPHAQVSGWSTPAPSRTSFQDGQLLVEYDLPRFRGPLVLVYEPQGGYGDTEREAWTVPVTVSGTPFAFNVYAPAEAGFARDDIRTFAETLLPALMADMGSTPAHTTLDIAIRADLPAEPWAWMTIQTAYEHAIVQVYLNRYFHHPSLGLGHEVAHDAIGGRLPTYMEEGLCSLWGWDRLVRSRWEELGLPPQEPKRIDLRQEMALEPDLLARAGYGTPEEAFQGYRAGTSFMRDLAVRPERFGAEFSGTLGMDFVREMTALLEDEGSSLQDVVCRAAEGERFFALLQSLDMVQPVPGPGQDSAYPQADPEKVALYPPSACLAPAPREGRQGSPEPRVGGALAAALSHYVRFVRLGLDAGSAPSYLCGCPVVGMLLPYLGLGLAAGGGGWIVGTTLWNRLLLGWLWPRVERQRHRAPPWRMRWRRNTLAQLLLIACWALPFVHISAYAQSTFWPPFATTALGLSRLITAYLGVLFVHTACIWHVRRRFPLDR